MSVVRFISHAVPVGLADAFAGAGGPVAQEARQDDRAVEGGIDRPVRARRGLHDLADAVLGVQPRAGRLRSTAAQQERGQTDPE